MAKDQWDDNVWTAFRGIAERKMEDGYEPALIRSTSEVISEEQQKRNRMYAEMKKRELEALKKKLEQKDQLVQWRNNSPKFYFASAQHDYTDIRPETAARLFYLAAYMTYGGALQSHRKAVRYEDLGDILGLCKSAVWKFWGEVGGKYIFLNENGELSVPNYIFHRGKISTDTKFQKIYMDSVRTLYELMPPRRKQYLGYAFQLVPHINTEYNILCHNIDETELDKIELLTVDEFCDAVGYGAENRDKLVRLYNNQLTFQIDGKKERFVSFVTNGLDLGSARIFVNPHVIYHGRVPNEVQILGKFCEVETGG